MSSNPFYIEISKENLIYNSNYLQKTYNSKLLPVLKAYAYGHDINIVSSILYESGVKEFAVARLCEGYKILENENLKDCKILIFETVDQEEYPKLDSRIILSANTFEDLKNMIEKGVPTEQIQIKIDFGFGRNGIFFQEVDELKEYLEKYDLKFSGIYSHLYALEKDEGAEVIEEFKKVILFLGKDRFQMTHIQNSEGIYLHGNSNFFTHIRPGIYIYGIQEPGIHMENIKQVLTLKGKIDSIRQLKNKKYLAYSTKESTKIVGDENIAKIKIGYGDGFLKLNTFTQCVINRKKFIINSITMDNSFIQVDNTIKIGDEVVLYPDFNDVFLKLNVHIVELICLLSPRLKRVVV